MRTAAAFLLILLSFAAHGQALLRSSEQEVIDFAFASQLGSGVYSMSGRTLQVYRLPFGYEFDHAADARVRPRLTLPVTLGFLDFEPVDVVHTGLPESLDSLSFVPGLVLEVMHLATLATRAICRGGHRERPHQRSRSAYLRRGAAQPVRPDCSRHELAAL